MFVIIPGAEVVVVAIHTHVQTVHAPTFQLCSRPEALGAAQAPDPMRPPSPSGTTHGTVRSGKPDAEKADGAIPPNSRNTDRPIGDGQAAIGGLRTSWSKAKPTGNARNQPSPQPPRHRRIDHRHWL